MKAKKSKIIKNLTHRFPTKIFNSFSLKDQKKIKRALLDNLDIDLWGIIVSEIERKVIATYSVQVEIYKDLEEGNY